MSTAPDITLYDGWGTIKHVPHDQSSTSERSPQEIPPPYNYHSATLTMEAS